MNLKKNEELLNGDRLYSYVCEQYDSKKNNYLFIDEIQMCSGFERVINSLYEEELYDIYLTGSNAFLLSSDLATLFGGRVFEVKLYPFSFKEYIEYFPSNNIDESFDEFVDKGGMSGSYLYKSDKDAKKYVNGIYRTTITKDIVRKFKVENADYGHLYENIVAIELLRRGYEVYVGKLYKKEVDFVAIKEGEKLYIQISDDITREKTFNREISPLLSIKDAYPKMVIARTKHDETQHEGIRIVDIARWLVASQI